MSDKNLSATSAKQFFLRLVAVLLGIVLLVLFVGSMLPRGFDFETQSEFDAPPEKIFPFVNNLSNWHLWSFLSNEIDPNLKLTPGQKTEGIDASQTWTESRGTGKIWITKSVENSEVGYAVDFAKFPRMDSTIILVPNGEKTIVKWRSQGSLPNGPFYGFFGMYFSSNMKVLYDASLDRLKKVVSKQN